MAPSGRPKKKIATKPYRIRLPAVVEEYLQALMSTGSYGTSSQDAIKQLIRDEIELLIRERRLKRRPSEDPL